SALSCARKTYAKPLAAERARRGGDLRDRDARDRRERLRAAGLADVRVARDGEEDERLLHREAPLVDEEARRLFGRTVERLHEIGAGGAVHDPAVGELGDGPRALLAFEEPDADRHLAGDLD